MKKAPCFLIIGTIFLCACGNNSSQEKENAIQDLPTSYITIDQNLYKNGLLYTDNAYGANYAGFLDYRTMQSVPLCNKPSCPHKDASCVAFQCVGSTANPAHFIYKDQIYWSESNCEIVEGENENETKPEILSTLRKADLATGTVTDVAEISGFFLDSTLAVRMKDTLYCIGSYDMHQMPNGTWACNSCSLEQRLFAVNLENHEVQNLGLVNDSPYVENSAIETGNSYGTNMTEVKLDGIYDGKLYMHYQYMESKEDMLACVEAMNEGDVEIDDADFPWVYEEKCYDPETGELSLCEMPHAVLTYEDGYCYANETGGYTVTHPDGTTVQLSSTPYAVINQRYWMYGGTVYDEKTDITYSLAEKYENSTVLAYIDGKYIVNYFDNDGNRTYESFLEKDLLTT